MSSVMDFIRRRALMLEFLVGQYVDEFDAEDAKEVRYLCERDGWILFLEPMSGSFFQ
jgi:hypothetical protein